MKISNDNKFWRWILTQLGSLFSECDSRTAANVETRTEIALGADGGSLYRNQPLSLQLQHSFLVATATDIVELAAQLRQNERFVLSFTDPACFTREATLPAQVMHHAEEILALDIERLTPFRRDEVLSLWSLSNASMPARLRHAVIKKSAVHLTLAQLDSNKANLVALAVRGPGESAWPSLIEHDGSPFGARQQKRWQKISAIAFALLFATGLGLSYMAEKRIRTALSDIQSAIADVQPKAMAVRADLDAEAVANQKAVALMNARSNSTSIIGLWTELTHIMPDDTWLQSVSVKGNSVLVEGFARDAEKLIPAMEDSVIFSNVKFAAPLVQNPSDQKVRFSIAFDVGKPEP
jgi:general secretion pathway protein L